MTVEEQNEILKTTLERIVTRSMSMYLTKEDMLKDVIEIAWQGLKKVNE